MATKRIDIQFDIDNKAVKIAGEETMKLTQQVRLLKAELASGKYSQEEFELLSTKLGDVEDQMAKTRARSGDLFTSLQLIPGPIGEIASKVNGAIGLLKTFSSFSLADITFQFKETVQDIKDIASALAANLGITKVYTTINNALATSFVAVGVGEQAAAVGARAFAAALTATGVGALVVGLGLLVSALMEYVMANDDATESNNRFQASLDALDKELAKSTDARSRATKLRIAQLKRDNAEEEEIRKVNLQKLKDDLADTNKAYVTALAIEEEQRIINGENLANATKKREELEKRKLDLVNEVQVAEIDLVTEANKELEARRQKDTQSRQKAAQEAVRIEQEKQRQLKEAQAVQREAELSLLDAQDRETQERITRFNAELVKLKEAGYTDFTALEEEFRIDLDAIDTKYNEERKAKEKQEADDAIIRAKERQEAFLQELDSRNDAEILRIENKYGEFARFEEGYYEELRNQYTQDEIALRDALSKKEITQAEHDKRMAQTSRARRELDRLEERSAVEKTQLVSDALGQLSSIVGQDTVAGKAFAVAKATIDTYSSAVAAYKALSGIPIYGPALGAIAAAAAVASGIATVRKIVSVQVPNAQGGASGNLTQTTPAAPSERPTPINVSAAPIKLAEGGLVRGPGSEISDSIPAMLSDGEFVVNARSTRLFQPILSAINASADMPGFAMGGLVDKNRDRPAKDNSETIAEAINVAFRDQPIRTYVTAGEISNEQQFDRIIKSRSLI